MKLYLISQKVNNDYDTYDSAVVAATTEKEAKTIHPSGSLRILNSWSWVSDLKDVKVECIGVAVKGTKKGVICASFNAG